MLQYIEASLDNSSLWRLKLCLASNASCTPLLRQENMLAHSRNKHPAVPFGLIPLLFWTNNMSLNIHYNSNPK